MKYMVSRTSVWDSEIKPCDEAFIDSYVRIDVRNVDDPLKIPYYKGNIELVNKDWYGEGRNHRVENGCIMRDFDDKAWFINISTLKELNEFIKKYKSCVIGPSFNNGNITEIEIYDDYRE